MNRAVKRNGFTIIELLLAMAFVSVLLLAIAMTVLQIGTTYNRGLTLKSINQSARSIEDELSRAISASSSFSIDADDHRYVEGAWGGRMCLGGYSYIWNYGKALAEGSNDVSTYTDPNQGTISFVKVSDAGAVYCLTPNKDIDAARSIELLNKGDNNLAIHKLTITSTPTAVDTKTQQRLYNLTFVLGTNDQEALLDDQSGCKPPNMAGSDLAYCAVQTFILVLQAANKVN